jgi:hypothetical protein
MKHSKKKMSYKKGGKMKKKGDFGMLSVKKGIDNNPNPTQADRIAGATMMYGGKVKKAPGGMKMKNKMMNYAGGGKMLNGMSMQKAAMGMKMKKGNAGTYRQLD